MIPASSPPPSEIAAAFTGALARSLPLRLDPRWFVSVASTMDVANEAAQAGAAEGVVIVADEQTAGRGRRGRSWHSPAGAGVYLSFIFRPAYEALAGPGLGLMTLAMGVAVRRAVVRATGVAAELKWPNDVMVGRRKLAGILAEGAGIGTTSQVVIVGIGLNVRAAAHPGDVAVRATSIEHELRHPVDRARVLEELLTAVAHTYDALRRGMTDDMLRAWREAAPSAQGARVAWDTSEGRREGTTAGIDPSGALLVRTPRGVERIVAGELSWS